MAAAVLAAGAQGRLWIYAEGGRLAAALPAGRGFALRFIHSINLSPVEEFFILGGESSLILQKVSFAQFGTGMPTGDDEVIGMEDGLYVTKPARSFETIELRVSPVPGHELRLDGVIIPLTRWVPPGGMLRLRASPAAGP